MASSISSKRVFPAAAHSFHRHVCCDRLRCNSVSFRRKPKLTSLQYNQNIRCLSKESDEDDDEDEDEDEDNGKKRHIISSWKRWAVGISLSLLLPSYRRKLGPLGLLINRVNEVVETTETVTEVVEDVAVDIKRLAEELERRLPAKDANGKLKEALDVIEKLAEETIKTADLAQELIDKVEEAEEMLEDVLTIAEARRKKQQENEKESSRKKD